MKVSQSLFYWNPFCNSISGNIEEDREESQSLFYWNPFCNKEHNRLKKLHEYSRNHYFIGILSAIIKKECINEYLNLVAILILLESFLQ